MIVNSVLVSSSAISAPTPDRYGNRAILPAARPVGFARVLLLRRGALPDQ